MKNYRINKDNFKSELFKIQPNITVIDQFISLDKKILIKDEFDIEYFSSPEKLLYGHKPSVLTSVNKTNWFIKKAKLIHGDKYSYLNSKYEKSHTKIVITCKIHGDFLLTPNDHLNGVGCCKCGDESCSTKRKHTQEQILERFISKHGDEYDYSNVNYINIDTNVKIICKYHGEFLQSPYNHIRGCKCPSCNTIVGYSKTQWIDFCKNKENSDPMVYIIKCFSNDEQFVKIGITTKPVYDRFKSTQSMPYEYQVIKEIKGSPGFVFDKEKELHKLYYKYKYKPLISFGGETECFTTEILHLIVP